MKQTLRRSLGAITLVAGCLAATAAYGLWVVDRTVLDPSAADDVARAVLRSSPVEDALTADLAEAVGAELPAGVAGEDQLSAVAGEILDDPRFTATFVASIAGAHRQSLDSSGDSPETVTVSGPGLDRATRDAIRATDPALARALPDDARISFDFEMTRVPGRGGLEGRVRLLMALSAVLAVALLAFALVSAADRGAARRQVGRLLTITGLAWTALLLGAPPLLARSHGRAATLGSVVDALSGRLFGPSLLFVLIGAGLWALGGGRAARRGSAAGPAGTAEDESPDGARQPVAADLG